ncbi:tyrosine-type recombinase/integrase [Sphingomonas oryzagri]|uniref:Tyrosine-type recombinase/integrase n=1 Tax=Sphingomonas oryzagri TaxID=3042314 RepID=A0ABT6N7T7_9SPHN|nr:tyrosine-type recombinase/integrase [Sphingomonas oryzagri]MDH7641150.1 tyrosine-type recombinase/integrase [Sphingomonas oryzagri]
MTALSALPSPTLPALIAAEPDRVRTRFLEFFAAEIRNANTRRAYMRAAGDFLAFAEQLGATSIAAIGAMHVAAWVEHLSREASAPTVKQRLAGVRHMLDYLVTAGALPFNPATSVRGPRHSVKRGKTPVLMAEEARELLDAIDVATPAGLRDRALIGVMTYAFARIGAVTDMLVEDTFVQGRRLWLRLHEKGGKIHEMPCHHRLEEYLVAYMEGCDLIDTPKAPLFQSIGRGTGRLSGHGLAQQDVHAMVRRRAKAVNIRTPIGNHTFRATGLTAYLKNGGKLEAAQAMANHSSPRTTQLYDRRTDEVTLSEIERVLI